jgi:formylglycine-generating enzyme required for sulfatase activity
LTWFASAASPLEASEGSGLSGARPPEQPLRRAHTGRAVALQEPGSEFVRFGELEIDLGSSLPEVLAAVAECARDRPDEICDERSFENEMPPTRVRVPAFYLSRTEVTVGAYRRCVESAACTAPAFGAMSRFDRPELPVTFVNWQQASDYCRFRGMRLPREAEFERAARGGTRRRFPWGELWNGRLANHGRLASDPTDASDGFVELAPVGSFPSGRTKEGVLDLAGNVSEWMEDSYSEQLGAPPLVGIRVLRGGDYKTPAAWLRAAARRPEDPTLQSSSVGFRCAKSAIFSRRVKP